MTLDIRIDKRKLEQLIRKNPQAADDALAATATAILSEIVLSFNTSPPGRSYTRKGVTHVASMPGYPPNIDINTLATSMRVKPVKHLHYEIRDGVEYGVFLELGTERMAARPFVSPVIEAWRQREFALYMAAEWFKGL